MAAEQIVHIEIRGFESIRAMALDLRPLNVLIGANGSGKSNFIEFFRMLGAAFAGPRGDLQLYIGRKGKASSLLFYGPRVTPTIDSALTLSGDGSGGIYSFALSWGAPDELFYSSESIEARWANVHKHSRQLGSGHLETKLAKRIGPQPVSRVVDSFRNQFRRMRAFQFHDTSENANLRLTQDREREIQLASNGGNVAVVLQNLREAKPGHYQKILSAVQLVAPFISDFELTSEILNPQYVLLRWRDRSGDVFGPHQLSDGTLRAIALITALLQPEETLPSIMLFDEPELGLHPAAIELIADLLKAVSLKRQVIVATQSPRLLTGLCPEDVIVVERREDAIGHGESVFNRLSQEELGRWLDDYDLGALYEMNVTGGGPQ